MILMTKEIPVVEFRHKPSLRHRIGCKLIQFVGKLADVDIDFEPLAKPGDRVTGYVKCPHCSKDNLVTVSLLNETIGICRHCSRRFFTMNDGAQIWILLKENAGGGGMALEEKIEEGHGRVDQRQE